MKLGAGETLLKGRWLFDENGLCADDTAKRIGELTGSYLLEVARDSAGWDALYRDPADGRLWELTYPESNLHGGGPPQLRCVTPAQVSQKYRLAE